MFIDFIRVISKLVGLWQKEQSVVLFVRHVRTVGVAMRRVKNKQPHNVRSCYFATLNTIFESFFCLSYLGKWYITPRTAMVQEFASIWLFCSYVFSFSLPLVHFLHSLKRNLAVAQKCLLPINNNSPRI